LAILSIAHLYTHSISAQNEKAITLWPYFGVNCPIISQAPMFDNYGGIDLKPLPGIQAGLEVHFPLNSKEKSQLLLTASAEYTQVNYTLYNFYNGKKYTRLSQTDFGISYLGLAKVWHLSKTMDLRFQFAKGIWCYKTILDQKESIFSPTSKIGIHTIFDRNKGRTFLGINLFEGPDRMQEYEWLVSPYGIYQPVESHFFVCQLVLGVGI